MSAVIACRSPLDIEFDRLCDDQASLSKALRSMGQRRWPETANEKQLVAGWKARLETVNARLEELTK